MFNYSQNIKLKLFLPLFPLLPQKLHFQQTKRLQLSYLSLKMSQKPLLINPATSKMIFCCFAIFIWWFSASFVRKKKERKIEAQACRFVALDLHFYWITVSTRCLLFAVFRNDFHDVMLCRMLFWILTQMKFEFY